VDANRLRLIPYDDSSPQTLPRETPHEREPCATTSRKRRPRGEEPAVTMKKWVHLITDSMPKLETGKLARKRRYLRGRHVVVRHVV